MEYRAIVRSMLAATCLPNSGRMLSPLHEVRIRVLSGLTMHPREIPSRSISVQKNSTSS